MALPSSRMNVGKIKIDQTFPDDKVADAGHCLHLLIQVKSKLVVQT